MDGASYARDMENAIWGLVVFAFIGGALFAGLGWLLWHFVLSHITLGWS